MKSRRVMIAAAFAAGGLLLALAVWQTGGPDPQHAPTPGVAAIKASAAPEAPPRTPVKRLGSFAPPLPDGPFARTTELPGQPPFEPVAPETAPDPDKQAANNPPARANCILGEADFGPPPNLPLSGGGEKERLPLAVGSGRLPQTPPSPCKGEGWGEGQAAASKAKAARLQAQPATPAPPQRGQPEAWARYAMPGPADPRRLPLIAIVIDDLGIAPARIGPALDLPAPMTMAVLPYAGKAAGAANAARARGHEVLVHLPMEAGGEQDPGPGALLAGLSPAEFNRRVEWNLSRLEGYVGVNNHMGSSLTQNAGAMAMLMAELGRRGLLFLDSRTAQRTVAAAAARAAGMTALERDVFLDNKITPGHVRAQLRKAEEIALQKGHAIAIGHPHAVTIAALAEWAAGLEARGFLLAPLSAIARLDAERRQLVALPPHGG